MGPGTVPRVPLRIGTLRVMIGQETQTCRMDLVTKCGEVSLAVQAVFDNPGRNVFEGGARNGNGPVQISEVHMYDFGKYVNIDGGNRTKRVDEI